MADKLDMKSMNMTQENIKKIQNENYKFNIIGLIAVGLNDIFTFNIIVLQN